jgi:integrase
VVKVRSYRGSHDKWEVDIRFRWPDGTAYRERAKAPVASKSAALRWGHAREVSLLAAGKPLEPVAPSPPPPEVPTLAVFAERVLAAARADRQKASSIAAKEMILRRHLGPVVGHRALNEITNADVAELKKRLAPLHPKTVNNILSVLAKSLKRAVEWAVIEAMPCAVRLVRAPESEMSAYSDSEYEALIRAAKDISQQAHLMILLGGEAGLRIGELVALRHADVDVGLRIVHVRRNRWRDVEDAPKGGKGAALPTTTRLLAALEGRRVEGAHVLGDTNARKLGLLMRQVTTVAGLPPTLGLHKLRQTYVTRLMTRGAAPAVAMRLARHASVATTMRYVHVGADALVASVGLLDPRGEIVEKESPM